MGAAVASLLGLHGRPYLDLAPFIDTTPLPALDDEICVGLTQVPLSMTGGSHRSMGIMPASRADEAHGDYGEVLARLSPEALREVMALGDEESVPARASGYGEERAVPLSRRQLQFLKYRHGVYFPWSVYLELMPGGAWTEKGAVARRFTREAQRYFPRTLAFVESLPFAHVGSVKLLGLDAFQHGSVHRDAEPDPARAPDHFISFAPGRDKRVYLWDEARGEKTVIDAKIYWFNDADYPGVEAAPFFRYSLRVDGVFGPDFLERLCRSLSGSR